MPKARPQFAAASPTPRLALSIPEFCEAHGISEAFFYKLKKHGEGPREMKVGARTLITFESAAEWRRAREDQHGRGRRELPVACGRHANQHPKSRAQREGRRPACGFHNRRKT
jgi:predicted DNA-binding transcriptional regulator AlpA